MKNKSMTKTVLILMALILLVSIKPLKASPIATVFIDAPDYINQLGSFNIKVNISNVSGLYGWEFKLYFNRTLLNFTSYTVEGHFLEQSGMQTFQVDKSTNNYNETHGRVWLADSILGVHPGVSGNGTLVTLTFQSLSEGVCELIFEDVKLSDPSAHPIENIPINKILTIDITPPEITGVTQYPPAENVQPTDIVAVNVTVRDTYSPIKNVTLSYSIDNGKSWENITMTLLVDDIYNATIPAFDVGTTVIYKIVAFDEAQNMATEDNAGNYYVYTVVPEFVATVALILVLSASSSALILTKRMKLKTSN